MAQTPLPPPSPPPPSPPTGGAPSGASRPAWRRWAPLAALILAGAFAWALWGDALGMETLRDHRAALLDWRAAHPAASAAVYALAYAAMTAISLPGGAIMSVAGGFLFGFLLALPLIVAGATAGAMGLFLAARGPLGEALAPRLEGRSRFLARLRAGVERNEISVLLLVRLIPAAPFFLVNLALAWLRIRPLRFLWTTALGIAPGAAVFAWIGAGLGESLEQAGDDPLALVSPALLAPLGALCLLAAAPAIWRAVRGRKERAGKERKERG